MHQKRNFWCTDIFPFILFQRQIYYRIKHNNLIFNCVLFSIRAKCLKLKLTQERHLPPFPKSIFVSEISKVQGTKQGSFLLLCEKKQFRERYQSKIHLRGSLNALLAIPQKGDYAYNFSLNLGTTI
jgi:hypothetical protein